MVCRRCVISGGRREQQRAAARLHRRRSRAAYRCARLIAGDDPSPGFVAADLVAHSGPVARGSFVQNQLQAAGPQFCERPPKARFAPDSPLEHEGFELPVPLARELLLLAKEKGPEVDQGGLEGPVRSRAGLAVRIPLAPDEEFRTLGHSRAERRPAHHLALGSPPQLIRNRLGLRLPSSAGKPRSAAGRRGVPRKTSSNMVDAGSSRLGAYYSCGRRPWDLGPFRHETLTACRPSSWCGKVRRSIRIGDAATK